MGNLKKVIVTDFYIFCLLLENFELIPGVFFNTVPTKPMDRVFIKAGAYNG